MHFSKIVFSLGLLASTVRAAPSFAKEKTPVVVRNIIDYGVTNFTESDLEKRGIIDYGVTSADDETELEKRGKSNYVSSCGKKWMPIDNDKDKSHLGYESAVEQYCYHITHSQDGLPTVIGPGQKHAATINDGYYLKGNVPAAVDFEIHNKLKDGVHTPNFNDCKIYLMKMADPDSKCYGKKNKDTKGGTWQVGSKDISYHGLPFPNTA